MRPPWAGVAEKMRVLPLHTPPSLQHGCAPSTVLAPDAGLWFSIQRLGETAGGGLSVVGFGWQAVRTWTRTERSSCVWSEEGRSAGRMVSLRRSRFISSRGVYAAFYPSTGRLCREVPPRGPARLCGWHETFVRYRAANRALGSVRTVHLRSVTPLLEPLSDRTRRKF